MIALSLVTFLWLGVVLVLVGTYQAELSADLDLDLQAFGMLGSALALGFGVGVVGAGPLVDRYARRPLFIASALCTALPLLAFDATIELGRAFASLVCVGLGVGGCETLLNAAVSERYGVRAARPLTLTHTGATIGAVLGAPVLAWIGAAEHWTLGFRLCGVGYLTMAVWGALYRFAAPPARPAVSDAENRDGISLALVPFAIVSLGYVGLETAATLFAVPYATSVLALDEARGVASISALWLGLMVGRLGLLLWPGRIDARLLAGCGALATLALAVGVGSGVRVPEAVGAALGLALGPVFPVAIALAAERFPSARGVATGLAAGAGALGGFGVPWITGALGDAAGVRLAFGALTIWSLAIAFGALAARTRR